MQKPFDLVELKNGAEQEVKRRKLMLGPLLEQQYDRKAVKERARLVSIPVTYLDTWLKEYAAKGDDGLLPHHWEELSSEVKNKVLDRYSLLIPFADAEIITQTQIAQIADRMECSVFTAQRWVQKYRVGGMWGLAAEYNPLSKSRKKSATCDMPPDIATLETEAVNEAYRKYEWIRPLLEGKQVSETDVNNRAKELGVSGRYLRKLIAAYREFDISGLAPKRRSDRGKRHSISDEIVQLVIDIRLTNPGWKVRPIYEKVCKYVEATGEQPPSEYQVRDICQKIPQVLTDYADKRMNQYRNSFMITYPMQFNESVFQVDHTQVDVLVRDLRQRNPKRSGETRPWLTLVIESQSRVVTAAVFSYDRPSRHTVASALRRAFIWAEGFPRAVFVDNGKELISNHVEQLTREVGVHLHPGEPHHPQHRGIVERFFGTLNTRLWATLPGYTGSNTVERLPNTKAELTLEELVEKFWVFIEQYHNETHSTLGSSPLAYWKQKVFLAPMNAADIRKLDMLMKERATRQVTKQGINYLSRLYWHTSLSILVGSSVLIRADTEYEVPDSIEVFHEGIWVCTSYAIDSPQGRAVTRENIANAQRDQANHYRQQVNDAKDRLTHLEEKISKHESKLAKDEIPKVVTTPEDTFDTQKENEVRTKKSRLPRGGQKSLFQLIAEQET